MPFMFFKAVKLHPVTESTEGVLYPTSSSKTG